MAYVDWSIKGPEIASCNCAWGCPCQFNALPTYGDCRATMAMRIDEGHFGDVSLDGIKFAATFAWPGAIHEGGGEGQVFIDNAASEAQVDALFTILKGEETEPFATIFNVVSTVVDTHHPPVFAPIAFEIDINKRRGRFSIDGVITAENTPITNPVTGDEHYAKVTLPHGFEYIEAEYANSTVKGTGAVALDWAQGHGHFAMLHLTPTGPVR